MRVSEVFSLRRLVQTKLIFVRRVDEINVSKLRGNRQNSHVGKRIAYIVPRASTAASKSANIAQELCLVTLAGTSDTDSLTFMLWLGGASLGDCSVE